MKRIIVLAFLVLALVGCRGLTPSAESALRDGISVNKKHMVDTDLPQEAREIATDDHDLFWAVLYHQGVVEVLPEDVRARKEARAAARGDGQ
ncbi:hypothetical protein LCGC14_2439040 [marine sediment metagenome]|uniref:Uncharacterized protein n=1 Tax=marine sediment metagenome TaxID=412755 RepID=A0A0F9DWH8_9ZZZZ